jgi:predicted 3-demethylubiquinone-9 3-methyltransferase (glyoxalase superfamily)
MKGITPFLWFDGKAEEAARFYASIFPRSKVGAIARYPEGTPGPKGSVMTVAFELDGQRFTALNGGPNFKFNESTSFVVHCETQEEVDRFWNKLLEGGTPSMCGWLKDKFGLSWQIVPVYLMQVLEEGDARKTEKLMGAVMQMQKLDLAALQRAVQNA